MLALLLAGMPVSLPGQPVCPALAAAMEPCPEWGHDPRPVWEAHTMALGINAAVAGLSAGLIRELGGGSFWTAFRDGALGGGVHYGGKVLGAQQFAGAGLLGRQVAAFGGAVARSAGRGEGLLDRVIAPLGPFRLYFDSGGSDPVRVKLDLITTAAALYATYAGATLDLPASISSGALVYVLPDEFDAWSQPAAALGGVILYREELAGGPDHGWILAHERVHVMQHDYGLSVWSEPAEAWIGERFGHPVSSVNRVVDWGLYKGIQRPLTWFWIPRRYDPWEQEALFLDGH